jgi:CheY-like chemotaxis protein
MSTQVQHVAVVADDDAATRRILTVLLERLGYLVWVAAAGDSALALIYDKRPDVLFLDARMPGPDGYEVCRLVRANRSIGRQPWVLMITAAGQEDDRRFAMEVGVDEFVTKPFSPSKLSALLAQVSSRPRDSQA